MPETLLDLREVRAFFGGLATSTLYRGIRDGRFPKPYKITPRKSRWRLSECDAALARILSRQSPAQEK
jgi:predicted DNA-binding transcriptional regulator AlpA